MHRLAAPLRNFRSDRHGVLPVEMALVLPVLVLLLVGAADVVWLSIAHEKLQRAASVIADLAARTEEIPASTVDDIFRAASEVAAPFDLRGEGRAFLSLVGNPLGTGSRVLWQRATAPGLGATSRIGTPPGPADLAGALTLASGENVVVGEVLVDVRPLFGLIVRGPQRFYRRAFQRPRYGTVSLVADPGRPPPPMPPVSPPVPAPPPVDRGGKPVIGPPRPMPVSPVLPPVKVPGPPVQLAN